MVTTIPEMFLCKHCGKAKCTDGTWKHLDAFEVAMKIYSEAENLLKVTEIICPFCEFDKNI